MLALMFIANLTELKRLEWEVSLYIIITKDSAT